MCKVVGNVGCAIQGELMSISTFPSVEIILLRILNGSGVDRIIIAPAES